MAHYHVRDCFKIQSGPAARDFGAGQGGEVRASPQWAVRTEPTPVSGKRPAGGSVGILKQSLRRLDIFMSDDDLIAPHIRLSLIHI